MIAARWLIGGVGELADLHADVGAHRRVGVAVVRDDVVGALRHQHHVAGGRSQVRDRALVAGLELAALVEIEGNLPVRESWHRRPALDAQAAGGNFEHFRAWFQPASCTALVTLSEPEADA
jgi:hypothetical protein